MNFEILRDYCLNKPHTEESMPFGPDVWVCKVYNKMFALMGFENNPTTINLKIDPEYSIKLQSEYSSIIPGFHMNKKHWITLTCDMNELNIVLIYKLIDNSYDLIFNSLPAKIRNSK